MHVNNSTSITCIFFSSILQISKMGPSVFERVYWEVDAVFLVAYISKNKENRVSHACLK